MSRPRPDLRAAPPGTPDASPPSPPLAEEAGAAPPSPVGGVGLRRMLVLLVAAIVLPFLVFIGWTLAQSYARERGRASEAVMAATRTLAASVDREVSVTETVLRGLAASPVVRDGDYGSLSALVQDLGLPAGSTAVLLDATGRVLGGGGELTENRSLPPAIAAALQAPLQLVLSTGRFQVSGLVRLPPEAGRPGGDVFLALAPAALGQWRRPGAVMLALPQGLLLQALRGHPLPGDGAAAVLGPAGRLMARTRRQEALLGQPATPALLAALGQADEALLPGMMNQDGQPSILAYTRLPSGLVVVASLPDAAFLAPLRRSVMQAASVALLLLACGALGALLIAGRLGRELGALARMAAKEGRMPLAGGIREVREVSLALAAANRGRAAATAALRRQEGRYRALVEATSEIVWSTDARGRLRPGSVAVWHALTGLDGGRLERGGWLEALADGEGRADAEALWATSLETGLPFAGEWRIRRRDGSTGWYATRAVPLFPPPGGPPARPHEWVGLSIDITDRRATVEAMRESEARFRLLTDAMPQIVWAATPAGSVDYFNGRYHAYTGVPPGQGLGRDWLATLHPDDVARTEAAWAHSMATGERLEVEHRMRRADGAHRWFLSRGVAQRDGAGRVVRWLGTSTEIEEMVEAREARQRQSEELERLVAERGAALTESERRLASAQRMEALGRLAGGVAHDVNNVLQAVLGGAGLIEKRAENPSQVRQMARLVSEQAQRGASVARRLLGFARQGELRAEPIRPGVLLDETREVLGHTIGVSVEIEARAAPGLPPLLADRAQLQTVLVNLAVNARDAMPAGGRLLLSAEAEEVPPGLPHPAGLRPGSYLRLAVADTGSGMAPEVLARVTEPFFTTKPEGQGTGLGLAMARGFAEQSGGALAISSAPGRGTTVSLWLPRAPQGPGPERPVPAEIQEAGPQGGAASEAGPEAEAGAATRILLVDDEPAVRAVLAAGLSDLGLRVEEADGPAAALALLAQAPARGLAPEVLVTDYAMPGGMDGLALLARVRETRPGLPGVLVTGYAGEGALAALEAAGRDGPFLLLRKPVGADEVARAVARVLAARR